MYSPIKLSRIFNLIYAPLHPLIVFYGIQRLSPRFCRELYEKIPEQAFLESRKGFREVTIGKRSNGLLTLGGEGWKSFIHDHELKFGDFMVFEHTGDRKSVV